MHHLDRHLNHRHRLSSHRTLITISAAFGLAMASVLLALLNDTHSQASTLAVGSDTQPSAAVRIGTYDSRSVAVAYVRSAQFQTIMTDLQKQRADAVKANDAARIAQLEAKGESMQRRIHLQGFST